MERTTFGLLFYIRRDKTNKRGEAPVFMRLTINGERADASIKRFIGPSHADGVLPRPQRKVQGAVGIKPEHPAAEIHGKIWIRKGRQKAKNRYNIPLPDEAQKIIGRYGEHPYGQTHGVLPPVCSNQKMNSYLKEPADICGIRKNHSTHVAKYRLSGNLLNTNRLQRHINRQATIRQQENSLNLLILHEKHARSQQIISAVHRDELRLTTKERIAIQLLFCKVLTAIILTILDPAINWRHRKSVPAIALNPTSCLHTV